MTVTALYKGPERFPTAAELGAMARAHGIDAATEHLRGLIAADQANAAAQREFEDRLARRRADPSGAELVARLRALDATLLFVPALFWKVRKLTGGDFARERALCAELGIRARLVECGEDKSVEENLPLLAAALRAEMAAGRRVLLGTGCVGALEARVLFEREPALAKGVLAWVNVHGIPFGTPIADRMARGRMGLFTRLASWWLGFDRGFMPSIAPARVQAEARPAMLPRELRVLNLIALPWRHQPRRILRPNFRWMAKRFGPNDGVAVGVWAFVPGTPVIVDDGADHYANEDAPRERFLALLEMALP